MRVIGFEDGGGFSGFVVYLDAPPNGGNCLRQEANPPIYRWVWASLRRPVRIVPEGVQPADAASTRSIAAEPRRIGLRQEA